MKKTVFLIASVLISILLMQFVWYIPNMQKAKEDFSPEKINLALRRTGHLLLKQAGDSTSQIPPIEQTKKNVWRLHIAQHFMYDSLPSFLQKSLNIHQIRCNYDVTVWNCDDGKLVLGYNFWDVSPDKNVPCGGRDLAESCYNIEFKLLPQTDKNNSFPLIAWLIAILLGLLLYYTGKKYLHIPVSEVQEPIPNPQEMASEGLTFANSCLDVANQRLRCGTVNHKLTYREAKLLQIFAKQPNQVLERGFILENVWADEGIIVGRSVDMFVSRLRKMLRDDPDVQLVAVHGVGYKMEIVNA